MSRFEAACGSPRMPGASTLDLICRKLLHAQKKWCLYGEKKLRKGAREMLDVLVNHRGASIDRESLGRAVGMEPSGGTFAAYLSDLKQAGLIVVARDGVSANRETLML